MSGGGDVGEGKRDGIQNYDVSLSCLKSPLSTTSFSESHRENKERTGSDETARSQSCWVLSKPLGHFSRYISCLADVPVHASLLAEDQVLAILSPARELPGGALPCAASRERVSDHSWMVLLEFRFSGCERGLLWSSCFLDASVIFFFHY